MRSLIIVDIQNDFMPNGNLAVPNSNEIIPVINGLMDSFDYIVATQDWHPYNHKSFASNNFGKGEFDLGELGGKPQVMWPDHCVQGSEGAKFAFGLEEGPIATVFRKGMDPEVDSYSGFRDNWGKNFTGLTSLLVSKNVSSVSVVGLALDYCVKFTALDAKNYLKVPVYVIGDACRGISDEYVDAAIKELKKFGVNLINSTELGTI